jgi:DNA-binding transcriptional LysR family regulator
MLLEDLQVVLKVAEFRSITAAAANLDMRTATASAALKRVESALGVELFIRTTRQLRLSSAGERYIPQCEQALLMLDQARQNMREDLNIVDGELRIALSSDLGRNLVTPWLDEFMGTHPKVSLRVNISDSNIDFYRDSVDIALRYGSPNDANLYGFKICNIPGVLCATQEYLDKYGTPKHPHDLASHNGLFYQLYDIIHDIWKFSHSGTGTEYKIKMSGNRASNDGDLVRRWCAAGKGLAVKSCLDMSADLLSGKVVSVMPEFKPRSTELWLIFPSRQSITPAARLLRDTFKEKSTAILNQLIEKGILDDSVLT